MTEQTTSSSSTSKAAGKAESKASSSKPAGAELPHRDGCPARRLETYTARRPSGEGAEVRRCIDCGASTVDGRPAQ